MDRAAIQARIIALSMNAFAIVVPRNSMKGWNAIYIREPKNHWKGANNSPGWVRTSGLTMAGDVLTVVRSAN